MRKIIAGINLTVDGIFDHTAGLPDEDIHNHYAQLLNESDAVLYGRETYQLMGFWQTLIKNPSGDKSMDDFALAMDRVPKIVFSNTLKALDWESAHLANQSLEEEVKALKKQEGKDILIGSGSLVIQLMKLNLIDEFQFCIHPVIAGGGRRFFENESDRTLLKLTKTKIFDGGAVILYYEPKR